MKVKPQDVRALRTGLAAWSIRPAQSSTWSILSRPKGLSGVVPCTVQTGMPVRKRDLLRREGLSKQRGRFQAVSPGSLSKQWVVYCKRPFQDAERVVKYLGRYTRRVAMSNERIVGMEVERVTFRYRSSVDHNRMKRITLNVFEFIHRFLLHILPEGFTKIRHYGILSNRHRQTQGRPMQRDSGSDARSSFGKPGRNLAGSVASNGGDRSHRLPRMRQRAHEGYGTVAADPLPRATMKSVSLKQCHQRAPKDPYGDDAFLRPSAQHPCNRSRLRSRKINRGS